MKQELVLKEKLPDGWELVQVRDILTMEYGSSLPHTIRMTGNIPVYGSNGIIGYHNLSLIDFPTVIVGRKGSAGEVNFVNRPCFPIDTTYYIKSTHNIKFIYYLLKGINLGKIRQRGVKPGLNRDDVYSLNTIFSYDPKIQKAFVAKLDAQMAQIEIMKKEAEKEKGASEIFAESILKSVFNNPKYKKDKIKNLCVVNPRKSELKYSDDTETSFIPMESVDQYKGIIDMPQVKPFGNVKRGYTYFE